MAVLIKGRSIKGAQKSSDHYLRGLENDHIIIKEVKGFATQSPDAALEMIELSAKGTKCQNPLYSAKINPETDRTWTEEELFRAVDLLEKNLGLTGHQRVVVEHFKEGRIHYHALWNRFPPDGGRTVHMGNDYAAHQLTQRQLEKEFKLRPMMSKGRDFKDNEVKWAQRLGFDIFEVREQITKDFNIATSGQEFKAKLEAQGIVLCRGNKSQFVIILPWGQHKALSSMIHGRPTKAILRRAMGDIDIARLPDVDEGKAIVKARLPKRQKQQSKKYRHIGQTYIRSKPFQTALYRAAGRLITSRQPKLSPPVIMAAAKVVTQSLPEYQPAPQVASVREAFDEAKNIMPRAAYIDEQEPTSRAAIAYEEEFNKWTGLIDAAAKDKSVPKAQRRANVQALRDRQRAAANAARKRVRGDEKSTARARRKAKRALLGLPEPEQK